MERTAEIETKSSTPEWPDKAVVVATPKSEASDDSDSHRYPCICVNDSWDV